MNAARPSEGVRSPLGHEEAPAVPKGTGQRPWGAHMSPPTLRGEKTSADDDVQCGANPHRAQRRAWTRTLGTALACGLGGCAALGPTSDAEPSVAPPQVILTIDAPDAQRRLLETYLDLARLPVIAPGEALSESELRRLEAATPAQARALLATQGYMQAEVDVQHESGSPGEAARVHIAVTPGPQTRVVRADIELRGPLADDAAAGDAAARETLAAWHKAWRLPVGSAFTDSAWRDAKSAAMTKLRADGYASAVWAATGADVDVDSASVHVHVAAESGPLFRVGELVIEGLVRHDDSSARNLADFGSGTPVTEALLLDYQERLQRVGLFERVVVTSGADPAEAAAATVTVHLSEQPLQQAILGVGISANNGPRVSLEHLHRNLFGEPLTMRNKFEIAKLRRSWDGELSTHTLPGLYRNLIGGTAERQDSDTDRAYSLRFRAGRSYDNRRADRILFAELEHGFVEELVPGVQAASANPDTLALTLNFHATWRDVDSIVLPTLGQSLSLQTGAGRVHSSAGGEASGNFARLYGRLQAWRPLGGSWYGQARLELGQDFARDAVDVPESQRFRAGGGDSVRGYAYRSLTPSVAGVDVGGRVLATGSIEVAHPISAKLPTVWWAAFVDAGRAAASWQDWHPAWSAGLGVHWRSAVGPLRADVAYGEEIKQWRLHLSVGIAF
jgi:translocation and assembly module TamA